MDGVCLSGPKKIEEILPTQALQSVKDRLDYALRLGAIAAGK